MDVPKAADVLGTLGAVCWSVQLIPQIIINYRRHDSAGLQPAFMMLWASAGCPLAVYNTVKKLSIALQIQPQLLTVLSLITWTQCCYYEKKWTIKKCLAIMLPIVIFMAGLEVALIFACRIALERGLEWPATLMAVLAGCLLCAGVLREYWDIYTHNTVRGISFLFCGIDAAGDVFSLLSVTFEPSYDFAAIVVYGAEFTLWCGIFMCGGYYLFIPWVSKTLGLARQGSEEAQEDNGVALHDLPSSTSVFRTPGSDLTMRRVATHLSEGSLGARV